MSTDLEREIRETLRDRADRARPPMEIPRPVRRRAGRRRIATAIGSSLLVVGLVAGVVVGARALFAPGPPPIVAIGGTDAFAVWPQTTREEAEVAQDRADAGDSGFTWQLDAEAVIERYATQELGWEEFFILLQGVSDAPDDLLTRPIGHELDVGLRDEVTLWVSISECGPPDLGPCGGADLSLERLVRPDPTGVWLVTSATVEEEKFVGASPIPQRQNSNSPRPAIDSKLDEFVTAFMEARFLGEGAERFLSEQALRSFDTAGGSVPLYGGYIDATHVSFGYGPFSKDPSADDTYTIVLRIQHPDAGPWLEALWIAARGCRSQGCDHIIQISEAFVITRVELNE